MAVTKNEVPKSHISHVPAAESSTATTWRRHLQLLKWGNSDEPYRTKGPYLVYPPCCWAIRGDCEEHRAKEHHCVHLPCCGIIHTDCGERGAISSHGGSNGDKSYGTKESHLIHKLAERQNGIPAWKISFPLCESQTSEKWTFSRPSLSILQAFSLALLRIRFGYSFDLRVHRTWTGFHYYFVIRYVINFHDTIGRR